MHVRNRAGGDGTLRDADPQRQVEHHDEAVGRECEQQAGLAHAAEVADGQDHNAGERQGQLVRREAGRCGRQREDSRRDRHRDRQHVVGEQRCTRQERRKRAEVLPRKDVRAAAGGIGLHALAVGEDDDGQQGRDPDRDREHEVKRRERHAHEHRHRGLRRVRDGRDRVRREDRQRERLREERVLELAGRARGADQRPLRARDEWLPERRVRDPLRAHGFGGAVTRTRQPACRST